jgi:pyrroline-5-carboxylate reductase
MKPTLLLVGCGKMGGALLERVAPMVAACVVDPVPAPARLKSLPGITGLTAPTAIPSSFAPAIVVVAIKPQHMAETLPPYAKFRDSVFLSIAAGQTIASLASLLGGKDYAIVRAMPNLPASIGQGISVAVANKNVNADQRALCDRFLKAVGEAAWIEDENLLDAVTALSGSGPAYFFAMAEAMAKAGEALGLPPDLAAQLARQTLVGSGALLAAQPDAGVAALRRAVTSPGGTTEAALECLLAPDGLSGLMLKAMKAAAQRAKELS